MYAAWQMNSANQQLAKNNLSTFDAKKEKKKKIPKALQDFITDLWFSNKWVCTTLQYGNWKSMIPARNNLLSHYAKI